jgi:hypothetical protein
MGFDGPVGGSGIVRALHQLRGLYAKQRIGRDEWSARIYEASKFAMSD